MRDPTSALIPGATVRLTRADGTEVGTTTTDSNGHFQFAQPAAGNYRLVVSRDGFSPMNQAVHVTDSPLMPQILTMQLADVTTSVNVDATNIDVASPENNADVATVTA